MPNRHTHQDRGTGRTTRMILAAADALGRKEVSRVIIVAANSHTAREMARMVGAVACLLGYPIDGRTEWLTVEMATFAVLGLGPEAVIFVDHWVYDPTADVSSVNLDRLHKVLDAHEDKRLRMLLKERGIAPQDHRPQPAPGRDEYDLYTGAGASGGFDTDTDRGFPGAGGFFTKRR